VQPSLQTLQDSTDHVTCSQASRTVLAALPLLPLQDDHGAGGGEGGMGEDPSLTEDSEEDHTGGRGGG
jgi:hypothetical protein